VGTWSWSYWRSFARAAMNASLFRGLVSRRGLQGVIPGRSSRNIKWTVRSERVEGEAASAGPPNVAVKPPQEMAKTFPIGLVSGSVGAVAGIGGATITIPLLCRFLGMKQKEAAGSALLAVCGTVCGSAYVFYQADAVNMETASYLTVSGALAAPLGAYFSARMPALTLRRLLGGFMMALAPLLPLRKYLEAGHFKVRLFDDEMTDGKRGFLLGSGTLVGIVSGTLGVSGGPIVTPTVAVISKPDDFHKVLGTSFMAMTLPVLSGGLSYIRNGNVKLSIVPTLLAGTLIGANLGSKLALKLPSDYLQYFFGIFLFLGGLAIFRKPL